MLKLTVTKRNPREKTAKTLIKEEVVPGVLYGPTIKPIPVAVKEKDFQKAYDEAGKSSLISLQFTDAQDKEEGAKKEENIVLIRDAQTHPVTRDFLHVDFYQLPLDKDITLAITIHAINEAPAVHEQGGILVQNIHEVEIKALPQNLIQSIEVDLSTMENIGDAILVKDLPIPNGVEIMHEADATIFAIEAPREEEEEEPAEGEEPQIADIKTEAEEKRGEEEGEEAQSGENSEG